MSKTKKFLTVALALMVPLMAASQASAAGESVYSKTTLVPKHGKFKRHARVPSKLTIQATVTPGATSLTVNPTKAIRFKFPAGFTLKPNRKVCSDKKLNSGSSLGSPKRVVDSCRKAVVGTGRAMIYLSKQKTAPLKDPILVAFNAGKNRKGQPKLKIYGYSKGTGVGILMNATLKGRMLNLAIPVLSFDSAVGQFKLQLPGPTLKAPDLGLTVKGLNPRYVLGSCPHSPLVSSATFFLGERDPATGQATSKTTKVSSPKTAQKCRNGR
ncbi:MAG: hypothetical protein KDB66_07625 [Solirubrobacterales bacterium]|nr:hypothetical protein [Solirubrobacterales bacterium]MCB8915908.1 hypothetical protein [Thermoleophilales bacterium]